MVVCEPNFPRLTVIGMTSHSKGARRFIIWDCRTERRASRWYDTQDEAWVEVERIIRLFLQAGGSTNAKLSPDPEESNREAGETVFSRPGKRIGSGLRA